MDKSWISKPRWSLEYQDGVNAFLEFAYANLSNEDSILCPCNECVNCLLRTRETVYHHLIHKGFLRGYTLWLCHGESSSSHKPIPNSDSDDGRIDDIHMLIQETFGERDSLL